VPTCAQGNSVADTPLADTIESAASEPAEASGDSIRVKRHSLPDQIAADNHLAGNAAVAQNTRTLGLRIARIRPPGAI